MDRGKLAAQVEQLGQSVNALRMTLVHEGAAFSAGLTRAAEEALVVVLTSLQDTSVPDSEL